MNISGSSSIFSTNYIPSVYGGGSSFTNDYSMQFDGVDESMNTPANTTSHFSGGTALTYSAWVKFDTVKTSLTVRPIIGVSGTGATSTERILFYRYQSGTYLELVGGNNNVYNAATWTPTAGVWYHMAMVYDGTQGTAANRLKLYIDGVLKTPSGGAGTIPATLPTLTTQGFAINDYENTGAANLDAIVDEVSIFDVALNGTEITNLYNSGTPSDLSIFAQTPRHWWKMGDGATFATNWTIPDEQGNGDLTSANMEEIDRVCSMSPSIWCNSTSMVFDGVDELVSVGSVSELNNVQNFSVSCWVKKQNNTGYDGVWGKYLDSTDCAFLWFNGTDFEVRVANGSVSDNKYTFATAINTWYHVCVVYDGTQSTNATKLKLYVDGSELTRTSGNGTIPTSTSVTASSFEIGQVGVFVTARSFDGNIDEVGFFDYSLTSTQVTSLYNSGTPTDLDNTSGVTAPVHWWRMGDGSDTITTINDVGTTGGNDGTPTNMEATDFTNDRPI